MLGESIQLEVKISPENVTDKDISWSSSNTKIADVSDEGFVTSIGLGKAIISAELGAITVNCEVNVIPIPTDE